MVKAAYNKFQLPERCIRQAIVNENGSKDILKKNMENRMN